MDHSFDHERVHGHESALLAVHAGALDVGHGHGHHGLYTRTVIIRLLAAGDGLNCLLETVDKTWGEISPDNIW